MMTLRVKVLHLSGMVILIATLLIVLINTRDWSGITAAAFLFMLWSEIVLFGGLIMIERLAARTSQILLRAGGGITVAAYSVITFVVSLVYMLSFKEAARSFFTLQFILLALAAILCMAFFAIGKSTKASNDAVSNSRSFHEDHINRLNILKADPANGAYAATLGSLAEDLRFTDISTVVPVDYEFDTVLLGLERELKHPDENLGKDKIESLCLTLKGLIAKRKIEVNAAKRGAIG